jgi:predicted nucleic acid-binding protein
MAIYYADSSTLVKRHATEIGSAWVQSLLDPIAKHTIITARISMVEVFSALNRKVRETHINLSDYTNIANDFTAICATEYQLIEFAIPIYSRARQLLETYPLRAYDSVQLASALVSNNVLLASGHAALIFVAADDGLRIAAQAEGLATEDPEVHP